MVFSVSLFGRLYLVASLAQHVVCRLSICLSVTFCIVVFVTDRPQMFAPTRGFLGS